jgi:hypothetical protein
MFHYDNVYKDGQPVGACLRHAQVHALSITSIFTEGSMRFYAAPVLAAVLASLPAVQAHAQAYGAQSNNAAVDASGPGSYRTSATSFGASEMNLMHRQRCSLKPSQTTAAEKLADLLVERARSAWMAAEHQPPASREAEVERTLVRTLERESECPIITHRAVSLARDTFSREDPSNQAFDLTLTAMDAVDKNQSCDCLPIASSGPAFGGPPLGNSGGGGGGVTHPPVASPQ